MHKNATKCKENIKQLVLNKHGASKIIDTFATYQPLVAFEQSRFIRGWLLTDNFLYTIDLI
jgi:Na+/H+ antiporter NhaB